MRKNRWLWIVLLITLAAALWLALNDETEPETTVASKPQAAAGVRLLTVDDSQVKAGAHLSLDGLSLPRPWIASEPLPLFSSGDAERTAGSRSTVESEPRMPPLPFVYAGKLTEGDRYIVFLLAGNRGLAVRRGDVVEDVWQVKEIRPPEMVFNYMPLNVEAVLQIGNATNSGESH